MEIASRGVFGCGSLSRTFAQSDRLRRRFWGKEAAEATGAATKLSRDFAVALKFPWGLGDGLALTREDGKLER
ncbi:MAG: hypothetical protein ACO3NK_09645 [Prochlorotrichaceae cyanobacterium]|jgi:hypothetical protein